jgi:hypothetical protein
MAETIMVLRHAEKPGANSAEHGVDENGAEDPRGLTVRGWQRAGALVRFFAPGNGVFAAPGMAVPTSIFAASAHSTSMRMSLTVQPLTRMLRLEINDSFPAENVQKLLDALVAVAGTVLICWRHETLPEFARRLCPDTHVDSQWPADCFDQVWVFVRSGGGWSMTRVAQLLLPGDKK